MFSVNLNKTCLQIRKIVIRFWVEKWVPFCQIRKKKIQCTIAELPWGLFLYSKFAFHLNSLQFRFRCLQFQCAWACATSIESNSFRNKSCEWISEVYLFIDQFVYSKCKVLNFDWKIIQFQNSLYFLLNFCFRIKFVECFF